MPTIAILLAAYNGEKWISEQIETILNQKNVNLHIYVSVDLSIDNTYLIVNEFSKKHPEITILPYGQRFGGAAPNFYHLLLNVPTENYDYVALSDQDDVWLENKLSKAICALETQNAFGYSSDTTAFWETGKKKIIKKSYPQREYDYLFEGPGPGCSFVMKKELTLSIKRLLMSCSFLNDTDWHDWLIYACARANGYKWIIDGCSYIMYRQHGNNQLGANFGRHAFLKRIRDITSGYAINQTITIIKLLRFENNSFVKKWYKAGKIDYPRLALSANKCRRNIKDRFFFFFATVIMFIFRPKLRRQSIVA